MRSEIGRTGDEGAKTADKGSKEGPDAAGNRAHGFGKRQRHGRHAFRLTAEPRKMATSATAKQKRDCRGLHFDEAFRPGCLDLFRAHFMQRNGNQGYQDEKCAWQIKVGYAFADVGKAKNVVVGDFLCRQPALEAEFGNTRNNQQDADDDVGQPGP